MDASIGRSIANGFQTVMWIAIVLFALMAGTIGWLLWDKFKPAPTTKEVKIDGMSLTIPIGSEAKKNNDGTIVITPGK